MAQGLLSKGSKLSYKATSSATTYTDIAYVQSIPDIGAEAESVEVTCLKDGSRMYINGIVDYGDFEFECLYSTAEFKAVKSLETAGSVIDWKITLADNTTVTFSGQVTTKITGFGVGDPMTFTAKVTLNSALTFTFPS